ncbi:MAG: hypothetical protein IK078_08210 [Lachnospiraceae bacterium]|nr:hypothetical protein [Lachnospiraceae bacterium]
MYKRMLAAGLGALLFAQGFLQMGASAKETTDEMHFYEWTAVKDLTTTYYNPAAGTIIRSMLCHDNNGHKYSSGHPQDFNSENNYYSLVNFDSDRQVHYGELQWLTDNGRGAPYVEVGHAKDGDNDNDPKIYLHVGETVGRVDSHGYPAYTEKMLDWCVEFDDDDLHWRKKNYQVTINGKDSLENGAIKRFNLFHNESGRDPVLKIKDDHLSAEYETNESKRHKFYFYSGKEVSFTRYPMGIWVNGGQVTALTKNSVLPQGTVTTVNKGAVMSINSTTFINGKIVVDGGTLVIQEGATLMTYSRDGEREGTGCIDVKNGGSVVVMPKARMMLGRTDAYSTTGAALGQLKLTEGGKLYNFGEVITSRLIINDNAEIENRKSGSIYAGYQFDDIGMARYYFKDNNYKGYMKRKGGTGGSMISASESSVQSVEGENIRIVNDGSIKFSSVYDKACGVAEIIEGNRASYSKAVYVKVSDQQVYWSESGV